MAMKWIDFVSSICCWIINSIRLQLIFAPFIKNSILLSLHKLSSGWALKLMRWVFRIISLIYCLINNKCFLLPCFFFIWPLYDIGESNWNKKRFKSFAHTDYFNRAPTTSIANNFEVYFERFDNIPKLNFTRTDWQQFCGHLSWKVISDFIVTPLSWPTNLWKGAQCGPPVIWLSELLSDFFYAFCKSKNI